MQPATLATWISDASLIEWTDTTRLAVPLPRHRWPAFIREALGEGLDDHFEGLVDPAVALGGSEVHWREGGLEVGAEWVLVFEEPIARLASVNHATPCVLQGMIQGTWVAPLAEPQPLPWAPATVGNNLIARGRGIPTTLGALAMGEGPIAGATVQVTAATLGGDRIVSRVRGDLLSGQPLVGLVKAVAEHCRETEGGAHVAAISLGMTGEISSWATAGADLRAGHPQSFLPRLLHRLLELHAADAEKHLNTVRAEFWRDVMVRGATVRPGSIVAITVADGAGIVVGEGGLLLTEDQPKAEKPESPEE